MRILIFADSNWRDSFGVALVKHQLQKLLPDAHILTASFDIAIPIAELFKPHIMLINHVMGKRNRYLSNYVKRQGGLSIILPTEGVPSSQKQIEWFVEQNDDPRFADVYLSWNETLAGMFSDVEAFVTGCPRFDIYQKPYNNLIDSREIFFGKYNLDPSKGLILFTSSFPQAKFVNSGSEFNRRDWEDLGVTKIEGRENPDEFAQGEHEKLQEYKLWIRLIHSETQHKANIAVKPHPLEDIVEWQKFCDELDIALLKGEYIFNAVANSEIMIGKAGCLTHQDSWLADTVTLHAATGEYTGPSRESMDYGWSYSETKHHLLHQAHKAYDHAYFELENLRNEWRVYLDKWGFSVPNSAQNVAGTVAQLIESRQPEVKDITTEDWQKINRLIAQHNAENKILKRDGLGHFGKAVTRDIVDNWLMQIKEIS